MDDHIDPHFMQHCEAHALKEKKVQFASLSSEMEQLVETDQTTDQDIKVKELFENILAGEKASKESKEIEIQKFKNSGSPAFFKVDEQMKRFSRMAESMGQNSTFPVKRTLVINPNNPLIQNTFQIHEKGGHEDLVKKLCQHVEDLASISNQGLKNEEKDTFLRRSQELLQELTHGLRS